MKHIDRTRRHFLQAAAASAAAVAAGCATQPHEQTQPRFVPPPNQPIYANLIHISYNMWSDRKPEAWGMLPKEQLSNVTYEPYLRCDDAAWNGLLKASAAAGCNVILMDLGDAIQYKSHPEIAVKNAWSRDRQRHELGWLPPHRLPCSPELLHRARAASTVVHRARPA